MKLPAIFTFIFLMLVYCFSALAQDDGRNVKMPAPQGLTFDFLPLNELDGYKFYGKGRLQGLKLGVSTREDVDKIFGVCKMSSGVKGVCDYDENWRVIFQFFERKFPIKVASRIKDGKARYVTVVPRPDYVGKVQSITFLPTRRISFSETTFPPSFHMNKDSDQWNGPDYKIRIISYKYYRDRYGLIYKIFDKILVDSTGNEDYRKQGELETIYYSVPIELDDQIYVEQN